MSDDEDLTYVDKLCIELDLHPRLQRVYMSYLTPPEDGIEDREAWVLAHIRYAFGLGLLARADPELVEALRAQGYDLTVAPS